MPRFRVVSSSSLALLVCASLASAQTPPAQGESSPAPAQDTARRGAMPEGGTGGMGGMDQGMRQRMHARHMQQMQAMQGGGGMHGGGMQGRGQAGAATARGGADAYDDRHWSGPWAWGAMIAMTLFWLLITALVSWVVYRLASGRWSHRGGVGSGGRAADVVRDRYARGEIDRAAYDRMMEDLERGA